MIGIIISKVLSEEAVSVEFEGYKDGCKVGADVIFVVFVTFEEFMISGCCDC